jgi:hypothetical protein
LKVSRTTGRPLRSDAAKDRGRLLKAARKVKGQGLEASVADVASAAGVGMGMWLRRLASKAPFEHESRNRETTLMKRDMARIDRGASS